MSSKGHARAFISLPQSSSVDPSSSLIQQTDEGDKEKRKLNLRIKSNRRQSVSTTSVEERSIARELARSKRLQIVDYPLEEKSGESSTSARLRDRESVGSSHSIQSREGSPFSSHRQRALGRSTSSAELWQPGVSPRPQLRAISSGRSSLSFSPNILDKELGIDIYETNPSLSSKSRLIPQPNRVYMDLAGLDLPSSPSLQRRYNSSLATSTNRGSWDDLPLPSFPSKSRNLSEEEQIENDKDVRIYNALQGASNNLRTLKQNNQGKNVDTSDKATFDKIAKHYRSSRTLSASPLEDRDQPGLPELVQRYPLPSGFTVQTYNAILEGLLKLREKGDSIAPVLEVYNEMLDRNILPNTKTYMSVIKALCFRERDVQHALSRFNKEKSSFDFKSAMLGIEDPSKREEIEQKYKLIEGYKNEGNLESALKLFKAAQVFQSTSKFRFGHDLYGMLLECLMNQEYPDLMAVNQVAHHAMSRQSGNLGFYRYLFSIYAKVGEKDLLFKAWEDFRNADINESDQSPGDWAVSMSGGDVEQQLNRVRGLRREAYNAAIRGFAKLGEFEKAKEVINIWEEKQGNKFADVYSNYLLGVGEHDASRLSEEHSSLKTRINKSELQHLPFSGLIELTENLTRAGRWRDALELWKPVYESETRRPDVNVISEIYVALLGDALKLGNAEQVKEVLDVAVNELFTGLSLQMRQFPVEKHLELLAKFGLWQDALPLLQSFSDTTNRRAHAVAEPFLLEAAPHMPLSGFLDLLGALQPQGLDIQRRPDLSTLLADKYTQEKSESSAVDADWTPAKLGLRPSKWEYIVNAISNLSGERYEQGEFDDCLSGIMEDLGSIRESLGDSQWQDEFKAVIALQDPIKEKLVFR